MMQPSLDLKPYMPFPVDNSSAVGLFPNFNTMDPVQKAVINHTFGVSIPPRKKQVITCNVCQLRFNSDNQADAHYKGSKHAKKLKTVETSKTKPKAGPSKDGVNAIMLPSSPVSANDQPDNNGIITTNGASQPASKEVVASAAEPEDASSPKTPEDPSKSTNGTVNLLSESEEEKAKKLLYCSLCKVAVNSLSQLEAHNTGSKHKTMVEARNGAGPIKSYPRSGSRLKLQNTSKGSGLQNKTFHCEICDVHVNSEIQLKQHISSRRHKDRVAGKPMKPKYSPYNKLQRGPSILASKLLQARTERKHPGQGSCPVLLYADETVIMQGNDMGLQHQLVKLGDFFSENELKAKLSFQKDLIKPMTPPFLSSSLAAAVSSTLGMPPRHSSSLFQASGIPSAFFRSGHGPIRATTASILFAPY